MQTLIYKKPTFQFPPHLSPSNSLSSETHKTHHDFLRIHPKKSHNALTTLISRPPSSPQSLNYGGWDDFQLSDDSLSSGESNHFYDFLNSVGIGDKKYLFVYLFGFVCASAISRVRVSYIVVFPACAVVFALGFSVGMVKGGHSKESKLNENRKRVVDDTLFRGFIEKLRDLGDNLKGANARVCKLKDDVRRSIECNRVTLSDLEGYIDVMESVDVSLRSSIESLEGLDVNNRGKEGDSDCESSRRRKKSGEKSLNFSEYINGVFGGKFNGLMPGQLEGSGEKEQTNVEVNNKKIVNNLADPVKERNQNYERNENLEIKNANNMADDSLSNTVRAPNGTENLLDWTGMEDIAVENEKKNTTETNGSAETVFDQKFYNYENKTSRFVNNQQVYMKDYQDEIETVSSRNDSYSSVDVSISMNHTRAASSFHQQHKRETLNRRNHSRIESVEDDQLESRRYSFKNGAFDPEEPPSFADQESTTDLEFNRYVSEANSLLREAKGCLTKKVDDKRAENALHRSALLLSKAIEMRPMSLLAVGQLGNTYLLHGELKLRMSRELRSLLLKTDLTRFDDQFAKKDKIISALANVCEECEELLIKAGRKYKLALSIDGGDMKALYNWGLALTFRAQLIADIGPSAAGDADKVLMAAIDKFDAMMSKSNAYAPDALFRWGAALQQRSRLRGSRSREKVKLLQQARRLYEDALQMDAGNFQLQEALSSCRSELDHWYR